MPFFIPALIAGASALAGALGNRAKKSTQESTSTTTTDMRNMPEYDAKQLAVRDRILNELLSNYEEDLDMSGYTSYGLNQIAAGQSARQRALSNALASRGLSGSPMAAHAMAQSEGDRIGEQINFMNTIPMKKREMKMQSMGNLASFFSSLPVGSTQKGTQTTKGTQTQTTPGNMLAGALGSGASAAAGLYGMGAFSSPAPTYSIPTNVAGQINNNVNNVLNDSFSKAMGGYKYGQGNSYFNWGQ